MYPNSHAHETNAHVSTTIYSVL